MDYQFPQQLFSSFHNSGPPDSVLKHGAGRWGCYDRVRPQGTSGPLASRTFTSRHQANGEMWCHTEPIPVPLLSPKNSVLWPSTPPDPMDFTKHMQNFFMDHYQDAFGCMGGILGEHFSFFGGVKNLSWRDSVNMCRVERFVNKLKYKMSHRSCTSTSLDMYSSLLWDVVHAVPPELLGTLLYEELAEQKERMLFPEGATGGALAFVPFPESSSSSSSSSQCGCLVYPKNQGRDCLTFHRVELQHGRGDSSYVDASSTDQYSFQLNGPVRQISSASLFSDCCVAVRSDHLCGVWTFTERDKPHLQQVINTKEAVTCINVSPHVLGEVLVASESGAAKLWTVGRGMQNIREEDQNLYFNANSSWRWCEFSAHPRVMLYADRTGAELTDIRVNPALSHTLFRISNSSECVSGERLILSRYLGDIHPFHHLITTQYSAYIIDERIPSVPMLKWDHMMQSPPMFCHVVPGSASSDSAVSEAGTTKVLLGSFSYQEITLLQYSGGRMEACCSQGPPQSMLRPRDSLKHLPVQIPHRQYKAKTRLSSPAIGLTCIHKKGGRRAGDECICILQLTEVGDIFYQILKPEQPDTCQPSTAEDKLPLQEADGQLPQATLKEASTSGRKTANTHQPDSQLFVSDTSDEDIIGPSQVANVPRAVTETPERDQRASHISDSSTEDSKSAGRGRDQNLKRMLQQAVVNDPKLHVLNGLEAAVTDNSYNTEEPGCVGDEINDSNNLSHMTQRKLSNSVLATWKRWLQKLMLKGHTKKPHTATHPQCLQHFTLHLTNNEARDLTEKERVQSLRHNMRSCMSKRSLLVHSTISASLRSPDMVPLPNPVHTDLWTDQLSQRLTLSWQGEEAWKAWWEDELGLNREEKVEALKRKRKRQKEAKRATGRRLELSGSFTSSVSYQSELDEFSDSTGWCSAGSQGPCSDTEATVSQLESTGECETPRAAIPTTLQIDTAVSTLTSIPQSVKDSQDHQQTPSSSRSFTLPQTPKPDSTPTSQRRNKHTAKDYLSSLFAPQDEPLQHDGNTLDEGSTMRPTLLHAASCSSQLSSSQSFPQRSLRVDLSQDNFTISNHLSQSQNSQGRQGLSQPKKRSRIGF